MRSQVPQYFGTVGPSTITNTLVPYSMHRIPQAFPKMILVSIEAPAVCFLERVHLSHLPERAKQQLTMRQLCKVVVAVAGCLSDIALVSFVSVYIWCLSLKNYGTGPHVIGSD